MTDLFKQEVQSDSITLNYTLTNPQNYGIKNYKPTFGEYTAKDMKQSYTCGDNYLKKLNQFDYASLNKKQKITYDVLYKYLSDRKDGKNFIYYNNVLSPVTGLQSQLPILLAEYHFHEKQDIVDYLDLLFEMDDYFKQILNFEKQKSEKGLFMNDVAVQDIIDQCQDFIKNPEKHYLLTLFNHKLETFKGLTKQEKANFKEKNKKAIYNHVIPAYKKLITGLKKLKGTGKNTKGLSHYKNGKNYYKYLMKTVTGSDRNIKNTDALLDSSIKNCLAKMNTITKEDSQILNKLQTYYYPLTDPNEILTYLRGAIEPDFPTLQGTECTMKYIDKSLENYLSPAFYLIPTIDNYNENCIYINKNNNYDLSEIFPTIAHEGYPGHLYQNCYYNQTKPYPIRHLLNFEGYAEGWAMYSEFYSYSIAGLDSNIAEVLKQNSLVMLYLDAKCDIGIHYHGWNLNDTVKYLNEFGITDIKCIQNMYQYIIEEPCNYLKYALGYLEMINLQNKTKKQLGNNFDIKQFHIFILNMGPCQFDILNKYWKEWIKNQ